MTSTIEQGKALTKRKLIIQVALGALSGAGAMMLTMQFMETGSREVIGADVIIAVGVAVVYALMALLVGAGTLVPKAGATVLNVVDAQELRDEKPGLLWGALACLCIALLVGALALAAGPDPYIDRDVAGICVLAAVAGVALMTWVTWGTADELMARVSTETSELGFALTMMVFGGWAALAILGYATMFSPVAFVGGLFGLFLLAMFYVVAKRGMMSTY